MDSGLQAKGIWLHFCSQPVECEQPSGFKGTLSGAFLIQTFASHKDRTRKRGLWYNYFIKLLEFIWENIIPSI